MVGDGEDRKEIENLISDLGISNNITITGWVKNTNEITEIFDIVILTSNVGEISNIIKNGVNGIL